MSMLLNPTLHDLLFRPESTWLQQRYESVSCETRDRLSAAAHDLRETASCEAFVFDSGLANAARKLERIATEEYDDVD